MKAIPAAERRRCDQGPAHRTAGRSGAQQGVTWRRSTFSPAHDARLADGVLVAVIGAVAIGSALFAGGALAARDTEIGSEDRRGADPTPSSTTSSLLPPSSSSTAPPTTLPPTTTTTAPPRPLRTGRSSSARAVRRSPPCRPGSRDLGYWIGAPDGSYGQLTRQAVMAFQKAQIAWAATASPVPPPWPPLEAAARPAPRDASGSHIEIDLDRQILLVVQDGQTPWVLNTSTGNGEAYAAPGGGTAVAAHPAGQLHRRARDRRAPRGAARHACTARSTSTVASPSTARAASRPTRRRTAAPGSPTRRWTCSGPPASPRSAPRCSSTDGSAHPAAGHTGRGVAAVTSRCEALAEPGPYHRARRPWRPLARRCTPTDDHLQRPAFLMSSSSSSLGRATARPSTSCPAPRRPHAGPRLPPPRRPPRHGRRAPGGVPQGLPGPPPLPGRERLRHLALPHHLQRLHRRAPPAQAVAARPRTTPSTPCPSGPARTGS